MIDFEFLRRVINEGAQCVGCYRTFSMSDSAEVEAERVKALAMIDVLERRWKESSWT